jgi:hypothetical protein
MNGSQISTQKMLDPNFPAYNFTSAGFYNPLSTTVVSLSNLVWPGGSKEAPADLFVEDWDCPFSDDDVSTSNFGTLIGVLMCSVILMILLLATLMIWKKFWNRKALDLADRVPFSQSDLQHILTMIIEFVQVSAMGPSIKSLSYSLYVVGMAMNVDLSDLLDLKNGVFWFVVNAFLGLVFLYILLFALNHLKVLENNSSLYLVQVI